MLDLLLKNLRLLLEENDLVLAVVDDGHLLVDVLLALLDLLLQALVLRHQVELVLGSLQVLLHLLHLLLRGLLVLLELLKLLIIFLQLLVQLLGVGAVSTLGLRLELVASVVLITVSTAITITVTGVVSLVLLLVRGALGAERVHLAVLIVAVLVLTLIASERLVPALVAIMTATTASLIIAEAASAASTALVAVVVVAAPLVTIEVMTMMVAALVVTPAAVVIITDIVRPALILIPVEELLLLVAAVLNLELGRGLASTAAVPAAALSHPSLVALVAVLATTLGSATGRVEAVPCVVLRHSVLFSFIERFRAHLTTLETALVVVILQVSQVQGHRRELAICVALAAITRVVLRRRTLPIDFVRGRRHVALGAMDVQVTRLGCHNSANRRIQLAVEARAVLVLHAASFAHFARLAPETLAVRLTRLFIFEFSQKIAFFRHVVSGPIILFFFPKTRC